MEYIDALKVDGGFLMASFVRFIVVIRMVHCVVWVFIDALPS